MRCEAARTSPPTIETVTKSRLCVFQCWTTPPDVHALTSRWNLSPPTGDDATCSLISLDSQPHRPIVTRTVGVLPCLADLLSNVTCNAVRMLKLLLDLVRARIALRS